MKVYILMIAVGLVATSRNPEAQINNAKTETVKVYGNCEMCETTIEKAGKNKKLYKTDWNEGTKTASITYNSKKTDLDAVLKSIALSGYDNLKYLAPDDAYNKLPGCCKYEREKKYVIKIASEPKADAMGSMQNHTGHNQNNMTNQVQQGGQLKAVFDNYFALKDALVKADGETASAKASAILTALEAVEMGKLRTEEHELG